MKITRYFLLMMLVLTLGGCATIGKITGEDFVDASSFFETYMDAFNNRDINKLMAHYSSNSLTYVLNEREGYYLTKGDLQKAFELKMQSWNSKNLRLVDAKVLNTSMVGNMVHVDVEFKVESTAWIGDYRVRFGLEKMGNSFMIMNENMK